MGLYVYRADEDRERLPYAPYVLREEDHIVELPLDTTKCGTLPGYRQHRSRGHDACDRCKAAAAEATAEQRRNVNRKHRHA